MIVAYINERDKRVVDLLKQLKADFVLVGDLQKEKTMGDLLQGSETSFVSGPTFLYFSNGEENTQQKLSKLCKENNIYIPRIAMETKHNIGWTLQALLEEIEKEYTYFLTRDKLYALIMKPDKERLRQDEAYLNLMSYGLSLVENEDSSIEQMKACIANIEKNK